MIKKLCILDLTEKEAVSRLEEKINEIIVQLNQVFGEIKLVRQVDEAMSINLDAELEKDSELQVVKKKLEELGKDELINMLRREIARLQEELGKKCRKIASAEKCLTDGDN